MSETGPVCLYCQRNSEQMPLIQFIFQGEQHWICPEHLPILIHRPDELVLFLPGIENINRRDAEDAE